MKRRKSLRKAERLLHKALNLVVDARINKAAMKNIRRLKEGPMFAVDIETDRVHVKRTQYEYAKTLKPEWGKPLKFKGDPGVTKSDRVKLPKMRDPVSRGGRVLRPTDIQFFRQCYPNPRSWRVKEAPTHKDMERGYTAQLQITWRGDSINKLSKRDLISAPFFTVFECWKGQCQARDVPDSWWVVSTINVTPGKKQAEILDAMELTVDSEEPEKSDEDVSLDGMDIDHIFDDLDAALCYLNDGGTLVKVPDSMNDDEKHWRLYVVAN